MKLKNLIFCIKGIYNIISFYMFNRFQKILIVLGLLTPILWFLG